MMTGKNGALEKAYQEIQPETEAFREKCEAVFFAEAMRNVAAEDAAAAREEARTPCQYSYVTSEYEGSRVRVMTVGKEAYGWEYDPAWTVEEAMLFMKKFLYEQPYSSPFWIFAHEAAARLNGSDAPYSKLPVFYANIFRIHNAANPKALLEHPDLAEEYLSRIQSLSREIAVAAPDVLLFLTGPHYDRYLETIFPGVRFEPLLPTQSARAAARVIHPSLPAHSFRLYHPGYAMRYKDELWTPVLDKLETLFTKKE